MGKINSRCPVAGCTRTKRASQVMCRLHWFKVPPYLRTRIWGYFTTERGSRRHLAAIREAVEHVEHQLDEELVR